MANVKIWHIFKNLPLIKRWNTSKVLIRSDPAANTNQFPKDFSIAHCSSICQVMFRERPTTDNGYWKALSLLPLSAAPWTILTADTDRAELVTASLQNVGLRPKRTRSRGTGEPGKPAREGLSARGSAGARCGNRNTLHLPGKRHRLGTRRFQRGKLIYGRNAHQSCYFLMGFGSLFLTPRFEMYPTVYSAEEFKHSDFLISRNHSSLRF